MLPLPSGLPPAYPLKDPPYYPFLILERCTIWPLHVLKTLAYGFVSLPSFKSHGANSSYGCSSHSTALVPGKVLPQVLLTHRVFGILNISILWS